jgi:hypothetical protein
MQCDFLRVASLFLLLQGTLQSFDLAFKNTLKTLYNFFLALKFGTNQCIQSKIAFAHFVLFVGMFFISYLFASLKILAQLFLGPYTVLMFHNKTVDKFCDTRVDASTIVLLQLPHESLYVFGKASLQAL